MSKNRKQHWEQIYQGKGDQETSWFQPRPENSLALIQATGENNDASLIDVGGGNSRLVDHLLEQGWTNLSVLDISATALLKARQRLGAKAQTVDWLETDLLAGTVKGPFQIWHDRAVFHFLTHAAERTRYLQQLKNALSPGGHCIIATFAHDGPKACSGLPVKRYTPQELAATLGTAFQLVESRSEQHQTPAGKNQSFIYCRFNYLG